MTDKDKSRTDLCVMRNNVSLNALRLFLRVAEARSFSAAALAERVSQPALSRSIRMLEDELGARLFDRDTRNVALTAAGARLQPVAERLLRDYDAAFGDLAQMLSGERGRVVVGALPSIAAGLLPPLLAEFQRARPHVDVTIEDALSDRLADMVLDRRIDFAIGIAPEEGRGLAFRPLFTEAFVLVMREGDALEGQDPLPWAALQEAPFIAMAAASSVRRATEGAFSRAEIPLRPLYQCAHLSTVAALIRAGLGVSALPAGALSLIGGEGLVTRALCAPEITRAVGIVTLKSRTLSPSAAALVDALLEPKGAQT